MNPTYPTTRTVPWITERIAKVCELREVALSDFLGKTRDPRVVVCREIAYVCCKDYLGPGYETCSYPEIAVSAGRGNHSTIITAVRRAKGNRARMMEVAFVAEKLGLRLPSAIYAELGTIPPRDDQTPGQTAHALRCARRLMDELLDGTIRTLGEARYVAEPLVGKYPTDAECLSLGTVLNQRVRSGAA